MRRLPAVSAVLLILLLVVAAPASAKFRTGPAGDAFYTPPSPLPSGKHGDLIWARKLTGEAALKSASANWLLLYPPLRTHGEAVAGARVLSPPETKAPEPRR